jgi:DNA-binding IclR family transcriptional regulator
MLATVLRTGRVLCLFSAERSECALGEVAEALGLPASTVHALLKTLCAAGLLRKTPSRRYALGHKLHVLAADLVATEPALQAARRAAEELARTWGGVARVLVAGPGWGPVEVLRAEGVDGDCRQPDSPHRCLATAAAIRAGAGEGPWCDVERTRPGWCCTAAVVAASGSARLVVDLCLPRSRFSAQGARVQASVASACRTPGECGAARAVRLVAKPRSWRGQLAR